MSSAAHASLLHRLNDAVRSPEASERAVASRELVSVLHAVVGMVEDPTPDAVARLVDDAVAEGESARARGLDAEALMEEYAMLRQAFWRVLREGAHVSESDAEAITRVDAVTTVAIRASLLGHSRPQLEQAQRWSSMREQLLSEAASI